jgi:hypothetical protein
MCDAVYLIGRKATPTQAERILTETARVIAYRASVGQRVFDHNRECAYECMLAHAAKLMYARVSAERRVIFYDYVARERCPIRKYNVIADPAIVRHMSLSHEEIVRAYLGQVAAAFCASMKRSEFAKRISLARSKPASLAVIFQIVRNLSGGDEREKDRAAAEFRWTFDYAMARDPHIVMQYNVVADDRVRADCYVASEFSLWADDSCGMNRHLAAFLAITFQQG